MIMIGALAVIVDLDQGRIQGTTTVTRRRHRRMIKEDDGVARRKGRGGANLPVRSIGSMIGIGPIAAVGGGGLVLDLVLDLGVEAEADPGMTIGGGGASRTGRGIGDGMITTMNEIGSTAIATTDEGGVAAGATATRTDREAMKENLAVSKRPRPS